MWLFDAFNVIQTNTPIFISESNLLTFYLLYPFLIPFRSFPSYFCLLSIVATSLFPASVSLACLTSFSFPPPTPPPFSSRVPTFWWNLHGNACYVGYLSSSSCVAGGVFATKPLFSQSVSSPFSRRQSQILFYSKTFLARTVPPFTQATLADSLSLPLQLILYSSGLFLPSPFPPFRFCRQVLLFRRNSERCTPLRDVQSEHTLCFLSLLIFPTVALKRLLFLLGSLCSTNSSWEHHIRADLLNNYDRKVRPVREGRKEVTVQFSLRVGRLVKVVCQIIFGTPF